VYAARAAGAHLGKGDFCGTIYHRPHDSGAAVDLQYS
jgi:hypothetical protein